MESPVLTEEPKTDPRRDPISGAPGAHAMGTGVGAAASDLAGKGTSAAIEATAEQSQGHEDFSSRAYVEHEWNFKDYSRAYRFGAAAYGRSKGRSFDDAEPALKRNWERAKGNSDLPWEHAKYASREAWQRGSDSLERACLGDPECDEK